MNLAEPQKEPNRCCVCGRIVGDSFTGYERDRMSDRGRLWCDSCAMKEEARKRPSPEDGEALPL